MHFFYLFKVPVLVGNFLLELCHAHEILLSLVPLILNFLKLLYFGRFILLHQFKVPLMPVVIVLSEQRALL